MSRRLIGTVEVRDRMAVCVKPDGQVMAYEGKPLTFPCFGGLRRYDAGKRIFFNGVYQMENDDQRAARQARH